MLTCLIFYFSTLFNHFGICFAFIFFIPFFQLKNSQTIKAETLLKCSIFAVSCISFFFCFIASYKN